MALCVHGRTRRNLRILNAGGVVEPNDAMPEPYRQAVFRFIELHANSEYMGGLTERDWIPKAPGLHRKLTALAKTQDEIGHAHLLYMVAADLGIKTREEMMVDLLEGRTHFHNVFHYRAHSWTDQIAVAYLVDAAALASQQAVFKNCSYGPYKRILRRVIAEEGFHMRNGEEMMLLMAHGSNTQHEMMQESINRWWLPAVQLFGLIHGQMMNSSDGTSSPNEMKIYETAMSRNSYRSCCMRLHNPRSGIREKSNDGKWKISPIDWEPLKQTMRNGGPDSARRISDARNAWNNAAWVRDALTNQPATT